MQLDGGVGMVYMDIDSRHMGVGMGIACKTCRIAYRKTPKSFSLAPLRDKVAPLPGLVVTHF